MPCRPKAIDEAGINAWTGSGLLPHGRRGAAHSLRINTAITPVIENDRAQAITTAAHARVIVTGKSGSTDQASPLATGDARRWIPPSHTGSMVCGMTGHHDDSFADHDDDELFLAVGRAVAAGGEPGMVHC